LQDIQERILLTGFKQEQMILNDLHESLCLADAELEKSVSKKCTIRELAIPSFKVRNEGVFFFVRPSYLFIDLFPLV
jgi:hypothetical protein